MHFWDTLQRQLKFMRASHEIRRMGLAFVLSALAHIALLLPTHQKMGGDIGTQPIFGRGQEQVSPQMTGHIINAETHISHSPLNPRRTDKAETEAIPEPPAATTLDPSRFYEAAQLSRSAAPLRPVDLNIPEAVLITGPGKMTLTLLIDARGEVVAYEIDAPGLPEEFALAIADTFKETPFSPAEIAGIRVSSRVQMEISVDTADAINHKSNP